MGMESKANKTYVYRIENDAGEGCYCNGAESYNKLRHHERDKYHKPPKEDIGIERVIEHNELCGFLNLDQVMAWFTNSELTRMRKNGYHLKRIKVREITAIGEKQVLCMP